MRITMTGSKKQNKEREFDKTGSCRQSNRKWASQKGEEALRGRGNILTNILWNRSVLNEEFSFLALNRMNLWKFIERVNEWN